MPNSLGDQYESGRLTAIHNRLDDLEGNIQEESKRPLSTSDLTQMKKERLYWKDMAASHSR